ncbi:tetratricopeptide repeat protein [Nitrospina watsonii]|uniref:BatE n=1 Tax=Nitrospina watsonii TaxID=1323948 RepID=A0ABN8W0D0_9BACT|nr:tetratricopeptide repeat protein [Nitrospina watsonii]CAI2718169.1 BatE [Nitrospina watsonii]
MRHSAFKLFLFMWIVACGGPGTVSAADDAEAAIEQANALYMESRYADAIAMYETLIAEGFDNGYLHYNLGNAYFREGHLGRAILHYLKAQQRLPRDEKIEANLLFALQQTEDRMSWHVPGFLTTVFFWLKDVTLREHLWALLAVNLVLWMTQAFRVVRRTAGTQLARNIALGVLGLVLISTVARVAYDSGHRYAVVLAENVAVYAEKGSEQPILFRLHEGAAGVITKEESGWYHIILPDDSAGWVRIQDNQIGT